MFKICRNIVLTEYGMFKQVKSSEIYAYQPIILHNYIFKISLFCIWNVHFYQARTWLLYFALVKRWQSNKLIVLSWLISLSPVPPEVSRKYSYSSTRKKRNWAVSCQWFCQVNTLFCHFKRSSSERSLLPYGAYLNQFYNTDFKYCSLFGASQMYWAAQPSGQYMHNHYLLWIKQLFIRPVCSHPVRWFQCAQDAHITQCMAVQNHPALYCSWDLGGWTR